MLTFEVITVLLVLPLGLALAHSLKLPEKRVRDALECIRALSERFSLESV
jgi:hypothetical protein